jgi:streptomycin 6-kinase
MLYRRRAVGPSFRIGGIEENGLVFANMTLHTGQPLPRQLVANVGNWDQHELTPGWLDSLPATVADLCAKWSIELDPAIPDTYITLVLLGHSDALGPVVIKSSPLADEFRAEATALKLAAGENVARLYDVDFRRSVMVIERIVPGMQLLHAAMTDEDATRLAAEIVATMWRPVPNPDGLHPLRQWMRALFDWSPRSDLIAPDLVRHAQELGSSLLAESSREYLLHGDFQHHNLLQRASGAWAIIDPKGVIGDPGFEIAAWMYNPPGVTARDDYLELVARRAAICAEVWGIDQDELLAWAFVGAVLSMCWSATDPAPEGMLNHFELGAKQLRTLVQ